MSFRAFRLTARGWGKGSVNVRFTGNRRRLDPVCSVGAYRLADIRYPWRSVTTIAERVATPDWKLAQLRRQHRAFITARLALVALFVALWTVLLPAGYPMPYGFLVALLAEIVTLGGFLWLVSRAEKVKALEVLHIALILCELAFHTVMVYYLGGVSWLGPIAYIYALLYAVVFLTRPQAVIFTAMIITSFVLIVSLDGAGVLPHQWYLPQDANRYSDPQFLVPTTIGFAGVVATVAFWMLFIGNEMRRETGEALRANAELVRMKDELQRLNDDLERKVQERTRVLTYRAEHDQLTGLLNRGAVQHKCREYLALARRGGRPLSAIVADADNFKSCNDERGHEYGDRVLAALAEMLRSSCRETDVIGRTGGDEFLFVLPDTGRGGASRFCNRLLRRLAAARDEWPESPSLPNLSLGIAVYPEHGSEFDELFRVADRAMYEAKADGGGRCQAGQRMEHASFVSARRAELTAGD